jgi:capsular polysaccharide biosynthesis protein
VNEQPLDLRRVWNAICRDRIAFFSCVGAAILLATVFTVAGPPDYTANALVLLPTSSLDTNGKPSRDIATQVHIASSADVLSIAARRLRPVPRVATLTRNVHVTAPTPDILQIEAKASTRSRAIDIANRVADSYVVYTVKGASDLLDQVVSALQRQAKNLSNQASGLEARVNRASALLAGLEPGSPAAVDQAGVLDSLRSQEANTALLLNNVSNQIAEVQLNGAVTSSGTRILQRATTGSNSALLVGLRNLGIALTLGLLAGTMAALFRDRRDRRLRRRDDIASAAGVPALASITTRVAADPDEWLALISGYAPSVDESWGLRRILRHLVTTQSTTPARVMIVSLAGDERALGVAPRLAAFSAAAGVRTVLLVGASSSSLRDAARVTDAGPEPVMANLWLLDSQASPDATERLAPLLVVKMCVAEDERFDAAGAAGSERDATTLLAVSSGFATSEAIAAAATAAAVAGGPLFGVIVANPRADDGSSGRLPQPLDPPRPRLPTRITGTARGSG